MSYEVTATRRRPQQFDDLVGQEFVAETLKNSIKTGKIAHAYLFAGPRGCGKTSTARILAKALNCEEGPTDRPCGKCSNCLEITKGSSLDVIEIDGASNTSVENIRQIKDEVMFPPANCRYKIYIIDEVHMLSTSAFNALLKTIEEPPEYVIFIFATTELQKVPATIKSRCQQYNFRLVSIDKVKACLADAANEMDIQADDEALFWIARESTGSMRDAYTLFDQVVAFSDGHITYEKIRDKLGLVGVERLNTIFEACAAGKTEEVINLLDEFLQAGISIEQLISNTADYLRSLLLIKSGVTKEALLGNSVERYSQSVLNAWNTIQIERALSIYLQLYRDIRYSLSPRYELELSFSRLCWLSQFVSNAEVKKAIDAAQALLMGGENTGIVNANTIANTASTINAINIDSVNNDISDGTDVGNGNSEDNVQSMNIPNGLPKLSGLNAGGNANPFYDGGPLPPEQSVVNAEYEQGAEQSKNQLEESGVNQKKEQEQTSEKELDERLKLHIPEQNFTSDGVVPTMYIPPAASADEYTLNPDDDDWSNTDVPPDDNYYPEDESYEQSAEIAYEKQNEVSAGYQNTPAQVDEMFTTEDGRTISIAQLKGTVMATFAVNDFMIASILEKTGEWKVSADSVDTVVASEYDFSLIQKNISKISAEIAKVCGKPMHFNVAVQTKKNETVKEKELPVQVKILLDAFRGTLVNG